jgi:pimeloyl-ACP methyl ester carboxylesterase
MRFAAPTGPVRIAYDMIGTGAPIVMLHGFGESRQFWLEFGLLDACLTNGRQVVLVDLRGHGDSSKPCDPTAYGAVNFIRDVIAMLDDARIERADFLGWGIGGRVALDMAAFAPQRVRAVAAGGTHPFAESMQLRRDALAKGLEIWVDMVETKAGGLSATTRRRLLANDPAALAAAAGYDRPDIADALARSGVPVLLFLGEDDPRYPLALSFAEQTGATVIGVAGHGCIAAAPAAHTDFLPRILGFFEEPRKECAADALKRPRLEPAGLLGRSSVRAPGKTRHGTKSR